MQKSSVVGWIEAVATVSVLIGIVLVVLELRQSNEHATAESNREIYQEWSEIYRYETEHQVDLLIAKAIVDPDDLTDAELYRLDDYYTLVMNAYFVRAMMQRSGLLAMNDVADEAEFIVGEFFYHPVARAWLEFADSWVEMRAPDLHRAMRAAADTLPIDDSTIWIDDWRKGFSSQ